MSLETLLEAARFVEQQEQRAKQLQHLNQPPVPRPTFKIISPVPVSHAALTPQLSQSPPTALVAVPQVLQPSLGHSLVAAAAAGCVAAALPPGASGLAPPACNQPVMAPMAQLPVVEVLQKPPTTITIHPQPALPTNGFADKPTALVIDENHSQHADLKKRAHIPSVIRSGTREVHNKLEKNRRAHLKECFEMLKKQLPPQQDEKKTSNLSILHSAYRHIQGLKKKERESEHEMERLAREKIAAQQRLAALKRELGPQCESLIDFSTDLPTALPLVPVKEEREEDTGSRVGHTLQPTQLSVLPLPQVGYPVSQGLVVGLHKVALVSKSLPLVTSPVTHIIAGPPQLNGKVVPLMNAQYLVKPVVVVSTPSAGGAPLPPRPS